MINCPSAGPVMVRDLSRTNSPLVRRMVPVTLKVIASPDAASVIAWRSEPGPLSFRLVTVNVAACPGWGLKNPISRLRRSEMQNTRRFFVVIIFSEV